MLPAVPLACFLSVIRPPGVQYENALLQIAPVDKAKCPFVKDSNDVAFQLFTRHNPTVYQELMVDDDERLFASHMDFSAPTVLYFHAFMEQPDDGSGIMLREAYMQRGHSNVIMVAAPRLEAGPWYFTAAHNTWYIGRFAATFVDYMVSRGLDLNNTHFVGHSLGAQAAGVAGSALTSGRVSRITGLDPALPLFSGLPLEQRLDTSDAHFVDVIHTDAGIFGYKEPIGHADFFPNGGKSPQPGCELEVVIPQQLLLNKCDGTEQTRGFYSYYLTSNTQLHEKQSNLKQIKPLKTGSKRIKPLQTGPNRIKFDLETKELYKRHAEEDRPRKYLDKKAKIHMDVKQFMSINKRVKRNEKINDRNIHTDVVTDDTERNDATLNNGTTIKVSDSDTKVQTVKHTDVGIDDTEPKEDWIPVLNYTTLNKVTEVLNNGTTKTFNESTKKTKRNHGKKQRQVKKRQKRFLQLFSRAENDDNFIFRASNFLVKNRKNVVPIISVVRDINTLVKSGNGELNHVTREQNNYIGIAPPSLTPLTYSLELGNESKLTSFVKRLFGLTPKGDRLTIGSG
ncbi:hypothetical protein PYW08_012922 [Mythimna loreyi]|uniref:Uncharacterized protein n=1 Tax=Mythimna loreyi TaxID=667449 RepID=A0ACC2Q3E8_9NEOP|nr:hypothetical protein PYW08_012922 [Mythimna loreyi]